MPFELVDYTELSGALFTAVESVIKKHAPQEYDAELNKFNEETPLIAKFSDLVRLIKGKPDRYNQCSDLLFAIRGTPLNRAAVKGISLEKQEEYKLKCKLILNAIAYYTYACISSEYSRDPDEDYAGLSYLSLTFFSRSIFNSENSALCSALIAALKLSEENTPSVNDKLKMYEILREFLIVKIYNRGGIKQGLKDSDELKKNPLLRVERVQELIADLERRIQKLKGLTPSADISAADSAIQAATETEQTAAAAP